MPTFSVGHGITRFEDVPTHSNGFMVRLCRSGERVSEFFSDNTSGGIRKAKKKAMDRYQQLLKEYGPAKDRPTKDLLTHRNSTGHVGVHIAKSVDNRWSGAEYFAYCASWNSLEGKRQKIAFSWNRYGKALAYEMACYARSNEICDRAKITTKFKSEIEAYQAKMTRAATRAAKKSAASTTAKPAKKSTAKVVKATSKKKSKPTNARA